MGLSLLPLQLSTATIGDIGNRVANSKLRRPELLLNSTQFALDSYLSLTSKIPFEALELTSVELPITAGTNVYDLNAQSIGTVYKIHSIRCTYVPGTLGPQSSVRLRRNNTRSYDAISFVSQNRPYEYARWGSTIELYPIPDSSVYTYRVRFYQQPTIITDANGSPAPTPIVIPSEWLELIYYMALYRQYIDLDQFDKANMLVQGSMMPNQGGQPKRQIMTAPGIIPHLLNDLLETINMKERGDEDFSVNPIYRNYTNMGGGGR